MSTQVAPLVARRLEPGLARKARRCRTMRFTRRRRRSCGRRLCLHRTRQYHRRRLHRTRPHHRHRTWPHHRRHRSASLPLRRRHDPLRRRDPRRLPPKSARRLNQSAERGAANSEIAGDETASGETAGGATASGEIALFRPLFTFGLMYQNGQGVPRDYAEALKWYRLAAEFAMSRKTDAVVARGR
jgi:hypothetical protein